MNNYVICVPSRGRSRVFKNKTGVAKYLNFTHNYLIIVLEKEKEDYLQYVPEQFLQEVPDNFNLTDSRQFCINYAVEKGYTHLILIDDNIYFSEKTDEGKCLSPKDNVSREKMFNELIKECISLCGKEFPIVGVPRRMGAPFLKKTYIKNISLLHFFVLYTSVIKKENISSGPWPLKSDRWIHISLLEKGYRSLSICSYTVDKPQRNSLGGCSIYRTKELDDQTSCLLYERFKGFTELRVLHEGTEKEHRYCKIFFKKYLSLGEKDYLTQEEVLDIKRRNADDLKYA